MYLHKLERGSCKSVILSELSQTFTSANSTSAIFEGFLKIILWYNNAIFL